MGMNGWAAYFDGIVLLHTGRGLKRGSSTHPDHANLAQQLTKEFLEENMHHYTQKVGLVHQTCIVWDDVQM